MSEISEIVEMLDEEVPKEDEIVAIDNLLNGEPQKETEGDGENQDDPEQVVEEVEVEVKEQIDYSKEVPMPDGSKISIGELKDAWQQQSNNILEISERENALIETSKNVELMLEWLDAVPKEMQAQVVAYKQQELANEHNKMLNVIPQWKDRTAYEQGRTEIYNLATEYGMTDLVANLTDHRAIKLLHDFAKLKNSMKQTLSAVKKVDKPKAINKPIAKNINKSDEIASINALLGR